MNKNDLFAGEYRYFAYPIYDAIDTKTIFEKGIQVETKYLDFKKNRINVNEQEIQKWLENSNYQQNICILKIPSHYFGLKKIDNAFTPCMPLIKTTFDYVNGEKNYIIPNLILGIYNPKINKYEENENYQPLYNPNGLQFADEQIYNMKICHSQTISDYATSRRYTPYNVLLDQDNLSKPFDTVVEYYENLSKKNQKEASTNYKIKKLIPNHPKYKGD